MISHTQRKTAIFVLDSAMKTWKHRSERVYELSVRRMAVDSANELKGFRRTAAVADQEYKVLRRAKQLIKLMPVGDDEE